jgi:hypothetical protein
VDLDEIFRAADGNRPPVKSPADTRETVRQAAREEITAIAQPVTDRLRKLISASDGKLLLDVRMYESGHEMELRLRTRWAKNDESPFTQAKALMVISFARSGSLTHPKYGMTIQRYDSGDFYKSLAPGLPILPKEWRPAYTGPVDTHAACEETGRFLARVLTPEEIKAIEAKSKAADASKPSPEIKAELRRRGHPFCFWQLPLTLMLIIR